MDKDERLTNKEILQRTLCSAMETDVFVIRQLRAMGHGKDQYKCFTYTPPRIKQIWLAAADIIEEGLGD